MSIKFIMLYEMDKKAFSQQTLHFKTFIFYNYLNKTFFKWKQNFAFLQVFVGGLLYMYN